MEREGMHPYPRFRPVLKVALLYLVFMGLYGLYRVLPIFPFSLICGTCESTFQHFKATFFTFLIVDLIEYLVLRKKIVAGGQFWNGRLLLATFSPWLVFLLWYIVPALYGKLPTIAAEIIYSNIITLLVMVCGVMLESGFLQIPFSRPQKMLIWFFLLVSLMLFMVFTYSHLPWADVFIEANWK